MRVARVFAMPNLIELVKGALEAAELAVESVLGNLRTQAKLSLSATETE